MTARRAHQKWLRWLWNNGPHGIYIQNRNQCDFNNEKINFKSRCDQWAGIQLNFEQFIISPKKDSKSNQFSIKKKPVSNHLFSSLVAIAFCEHLAEPRQTRRPDSLKPDARIYEWRTDPQDASLADSRSSWLLVRDLKNSYTAFYSRSCILLPIDFSLIIKKRTLFEDDIQQQQEMYK